MLVLPRAKASSCIQAKVGIQQPKNWTFGKFVQFERFEANCRFPGKLRQNPHRTKSARTRRCKGRDHPDGISQLRFRFTWGGVAFLGNNLLFLIGRDARLHKTLWKTLRNRLVRCPPNLGQKKVKKTSFFGFATCFFSTRWCGVARKRFFVILDPFLDSFSDFCQARNTGFYGIFVFYRSFTAIFKNAKTIVNTSVLCRPVAKNLANTTVFGRWVKKQCKLRCYWPPDLQKPRYLQWFLPPRARKPCKKRHFCRFFHVFVVVVVVVVVTAALA